MLANCGFPVAIKYPINIHYDWLTTTKDGELFIITASKSEYDHTKSDTITDPN